MKILIITQDEPIYLRKYLFLLIDLLLVDHKICGVVLNGPNPTGKQLSRIGKLLVALKVFGFRFTILHSILLLYTKLFSVSAKKRLRTRSIPEIELVNGLNEKSSLNIIADLQPDVIISFASNQIFRTDLLSIP